MKIKSLAFLTFLTIGVFSGCNDKENIQADIVANTNKEVKKVEQIAAFNLVTSDDKSLKITFDTKSTIWNIEGLNGKVILLDFFGTWCPPCKAEIPHLNHLRNVMKGKFEVIGIDIGQRDGSATSIAKLKDFIKEFSIKYPVTIGNENYKLYGGLSALNPDGGIPFMVLLDTKGKYVTRYVGMVPEEMIQRDINKALAAK